MKNFQHLKTVKCKICCGRKSQLVVLCQVLTNPSWQLTPKLAATFPGSGHNPCILHCHQQYYQGPTQPRIINWPTNALETEVPSLRSQCCQKWLPPITQLMYSLQAPPTLRPAILFATCGCGTCTCPHIQNLDIDCSLSCSFLKAHILGFQYHYKLFLWKMTDLSCVVQYRRTFNCKHNCELPFRL